jgi:alpha-glucosidase
LRVNIYDSDEKQYTIPESIISRPPAPSDSFKESSDLVFNYEPAPFAFWITRRSDPSLPPLFDTRLGSLPSAPLPPVIESDTSTALDGFDLVFEDQYLQVFDFTRYHQMKRLTRLNSLPPLFPKMRIYMA